MLRGGSTAPHGLARRLVVVLTGAALADGDGTFWLGLVPGSVSRLAPGGP